MTSQHRSVTGALTDDGRERILRSRPTHDLELGGHLVEPEHRNDPYSGRRLGVGAH
jgi:hypothetical protein